MKILLLNFHIDAQHKITQALKARGMAPLLPTNAEEAWQVLRLHATSVDLALLHREGVKGSDPGIELLYRIKRDPNQSDLPVILSTETWTPEDCASHQQTPMGANAYLKWPFTETELFATIDAIFGTSSGSVPKPHAGLPPPPEAPTESSLEISSEPPMEFTSGAISLPPTSAGISVMLETPTQASSPEIVPEIATLEPVASEAPPPPAGQFVLEDSASFLSPQAPSPGGIQFDAPDAISVPNLEAGSGPILEQEDSPPPPPMTEMPVHDDAPMALEQGPVQHATQVAEPSVIEYVLPTVTSAPKTQTTQAAPATSVVMEAPPVEDSDLAEEMPYLFNQRESSRSVNVDAKSFSHAFSQPLGDAVVPGGAAQAPDTETFKKYLLLREQDVAALSAQLKAAQDELASVKTQYLTERSESESLGYLVQDQKRKLEDFEREKALSLQGLQAELAELRFQNKAKADKAKLLELQVQEVSSDIERLKERVRSDIRKIRVRERELENKLEIAKKDSEAILTARENKIIELKRKLDLLEFNMDLLQDRYAREKESSEKLREKVAKAAQVVRVAEGLLDEPKVS